MADETTMTPVEGAEPPKANPLAKPAAASSTLTLKPIARAGESAATAAKPTLPGGLKLPPKPGLPTQTGLKLPPKPGLPTAGLKLPPKPGLPTAGLKLPPKPGLPTQTGLKLPPKPGLATAGLKLPSKPIIRKPGATGATQTSLRPALSGLRKPTLPGVTKPAPATPAAGTAPAAAAVAKPIAAPVSPASAPTSVPAASVAELTPVTPTEVKPASPVAELTPVTPTEAKTVVSEVKPPHQTAALDALKNATQNLKSVTAPIPQQAILRKTGMLAEEKSEGQKQAAKSKTSRISLSEAMGAAPVQNENAPMKTIRIRRPIDIPSLTKPAAPAAASSGSTDTQAPTVVRDAAAPSGEPEKSAEPAVSMTQRKTLKISRPSGGVVRPSGKFGIKRPGTATASKAAKPAADKSADAAAPAAEGDVPEIADIPSLPTDPVPPPVASGEPDLPKAVSIIGILVQAAACVTMGALAWWLYNDTQILPF